MGERAAVHRIPYERSCCPAPWRLLRGPSESPGQQRGLGAGRDKMAKHVRVGFSLGLCPRCPEAEANWEPGLRRLGKKKKKKHCRWNKPHITFFSSLAKIKRWEKAASLTSPPHSASWSWWLKQHLFGFCKGPLPAKLPWEVGWSCGGQLRSWVK